MQLSISQSTIEFSGRFLGAGAIPPFRGATLRGAFGYHLRFMVCPNFQKKCVDCESRYRCVYSRIFEGTPSENRQIMTRYESIPQPFTFILPMNEETQIKNDLPFVFTVRLFGESSSLLPYIASAFFKMGESGLGQERIPFSIEKITQIDQEPTILFQSSVNQIYLPKPIPITYCPAENHTDNDRSLSVTLETQTPLNIRRDGRTAGSLQFVDIISAALRRMTIMNYFYGTGESIPQEDTHLMLDSAKEVTLTQDTLRFYDLNRYSGRQERSMKLAGLIGSLSFSGVTPPLLEILRTAEQLGLGKSTGFGFGSIRVTSCKRSI